MCNMSESPSAPSSTPASRLKRARESGGYRTAKEFAEKNNIPQPTYALHESGKRGLSVDVAARYGAILGVSAQYILFGNTELSLNSSEETILQCFRAMSQESQRAFLRLAAATAKADSQPHEPDNTDSKPSEAAS